MLELQNLFFSEGAIFLTAAPNDMSFHGYISM